MLRSARNPDTEPVITMDPPVPDAAIARAHSRRQRNVPRRFTSWVRSHSSAVMASSGASPPTPAFRNARSRPASRSVAAATPATTAFSSATSQTSATSPSPSRAWTSSTATRLPASLSWRTIARPIPRDPPVTSAALPSTDMAVPPSAAEVDVEDRRTPREAPAVGRADQLVLVAAGHADAHAVAGLAPVGDDHGAALSRAVAIDLDDGVGGDVDEAVAGGLGHLDQGVAAGDRRTPVLHDAIGGERVGPGLGVDVVEGPVVAGRELPDGQMVEHPFQCVGHRSPPVAGWIKTVLCIILLLAATP